MPLILASLLGGLISITGSILGRVLIGMGISFIAFKGVGVASEWIYSQVRGSLAGMPDEVLSFLGFLWVDKAISMTFSVWTACLALKMAGSDVVKKMVVK
jgi:hypothetical protein